MKRGLMAGMTCTLLLSLLGCSGNEISQGLSKSGGYDSDEAIKRGDVVYTAFGSYNLKTFEQFLSNVSSKKEDKIRITSYTHEGDPIFQDLQFDGSEIHYSYDNSYDQNGVPEQVENSCKEVRVEEIDKERVTFFISNCQDGEEYSLIDLHKGQVAYES